MYKVFQRSTFKQLPKRLAIVTSLCLSGLTIAHADTILIMGDSISAGYGMDRGQGWVDQLQKRLNQKYPKQHRVVNASMSGETTSGALARLPNLLKKYKPDVVVIELGGNDGLRGQPPKIIENNLSKMVQLSQNTKAEVLLFGMKIPPNYGTKYSQAFESNYKTVATKYKIELLPFFLDGVAGHKNLMQADQIHPNVKAQSILLNSAWKYIEPTVK
ncbi:acyl-CoA thioesterase-1 [Acinetobacter marinus]|uniref:Acyl-CoA thioesterase-1 n=1 Tax=Acinetobacter marinus TaxID=281375 RepID=A0A1G6GQM1_9GAMM|nr:arylesterase [Acinetobacter marinus]SDB84035.1 acyl-CoA thioesterase-1 [Acinetobacter marinus]